MRPALLRASMVGFTAMICIVLIFALMAFTMVRSELGSDPDLGGAIYLMWSPFAMLAPLGLPIFILIVGLLTLWQTRSISLDADVRESKKQLMVSVWISTLIATLPFLLLTLGLMYVSMNTSPSDPGDPAGLGMVMFFSMMCLFWNLLLIAVMGPIARLWVRGQAADQRIPVLK
jgi:hypothetical protein